MLLVLDTSLPGLTMGLFSDENQPLATCADVSPRAADTLHTRLAQALEKHHLTPQSLRQVAVTTGPGSFTGIRIGLAVAQALKLTHPKLTLTGLSTLHALALQIMEGEGQQQPFTILLDAAGHTAYRQTFAPDATPTTPAECVPSATPTPHRAYASATLMRPQTRPLPQLQPKTLAAMARNPAFHLPPQPVYIKPLSYKTSTQSGI